MYSADSTLNSRQLRVGDLIPPNSILLIIHQRPVQRAGAAAQQMLSSLLHVMLLLTPMTTDWD